MELKDKIEKQIEAGFTLDEIIKNLLADGYSREEINDNFKAVSAQIKKTGKIPARSLFIGIAFSVIVLVRIALFAQTGSVLMFIGIFTGIIIAVLAFARRA